LAFSLFDSGFSALPACAFFMCLLGRATGDLKVSDSIFRTELYGLEIESSSRHSSFRATLSPWHCVHAWISTELSPFVWVFFFLFLSFFLTGRHFGGIQEMEINHLRLVDWIELVWQTGPGC